MLDHWLPPPTTIPSFSIKLEFFQGLTAAVPPNREPPHIITCRCLLLLLRYANSWLLQLLKVSIFYFYYFIHSIAAMTSLPQILFHQHQPLLRYDSSSFTNFLYSAPWVSHHTQFYMYVLACVHVSLPYLFFCNSDFVCNSGGTMQKKRSHLLLLPVVYVIPWYSAFPANMSMQFTPNVHMYI